MCKCTLTCYILIFLQEVRWLSGSHEVTSHCLFWLWYIWLWTGWTFSFCYISLNHTAMQQVRLYVSVLAYCVAVLGCVCVCVSGRGIILNFSPMYSSEVNKPDPIKAKHIMQQHQGRSSVKNLKNFIELIFEGASSLLMLSGHFPDTHLMFQRSLELIYC